MNVTNLAPPVRSPRTAAGTTNTSAHHNGNSKQPPLVKVPDTSSIVLPEDAPLNEASDWMEPEIIEGLTLYDIYREPRRQITDDREIEIPCRVLNAELTCPVCLGILRQTMVVMECLHRFCAECINKCLRLGRKECPSCRIHVPSRRSLRPDPNFDALIATLYPNLDAYEEQEEKIIDETNKRAAVNAFADACRRGQERQLMNRRKRRPGSGSSAATGPELPPGSSGSTSARAKSAINGKQKQLQSAAPLGPSANNVTGGATKKAKLEELLDPSEQVDFVLRRHPLEDRVPNLEREYLRTSKHLKVHHMMKFLAKKVSYPQFRDFEVIVVSRGCAVILDDHLTLGEILQRYWHYNGELVLYFRLIAKETASTSSESTHSHSVQPQVATS